MGFGADNRLDALLVRQTRIFEQAQAELECEDAGHGFVDQRLIQQAGLHGLDGTFVDFGVVMIRSLPALTASAAACT